MNKKLKVLILVWSADHNGYKKMVDSIRKTWGSKPEDGIDILYYYGYREGYSKPPKGDVFRKDDIVISGFEENIKNIGRKTLLTFDYVLKNFDFDYVFRCCAGSYIDQKQLLKHISNAPKEKYYDGIEGEYENVKYASGSGYFLSKDLVKLIVDSKEKWNHDFPDDVAIGDILHKSGINLAGKARRINLYGNEHLKINNMDNKHYQYHYHFRKNIDFMFKIEKCIKEMEQINSIYAQFCNTNLDINEHLPALRNYALECEHVTEVGVRYGISTWSFLSGCPKKLVSIDVRKDFFDDSYEKIKNILETDNIEFVFLNKDILKTDIEPTDFLFIDSLHTYAQLKNELGLHSDKVRKYIALHDVERFKDKDEDIYAHASDIVKNKTSNKHGLIAAIDEFLSVHKEWKVKKHYRNNNGLMILERQIA